MLVKNVLCLKSGANLTFKNNNAIVYILFLISICKCLSFLGVKKYALYASEGPILAL